MKIGGANRRCERKRMKNTVHRFQENLRDKVFVPIDPRGGYCILTEGNEMDELSHCSTHSIRTHGDIGCTIIYDFSFFCHDTVVCMRTHWF